MRATTKALAALASAALYLPSAAQTWSNCNPTLRSDCPPDSALGKTVNIDFSSKSDSFTPQGNPTYGKDGVAFTISKSGDAPQLTSLWYIMFGRVDIQVKAAPGAGIVSSFVLQSDTLDEIDWEWLGADPDEVQTNYFGKGQTTDYNRGAFHSDPGSQSGFKTYTIEWTPEQIVWQIDGTTVRTLEPANANNQYPQTPMQIKFGAWSGGDSANPAGTISWARGPTDYSQGPFTMYVKSLKVQDYSTGTQYIYGDSSGTWKSIQSNGGKIFAGGNAPIANAPAITATATGAPLPFTPHQTGNTERPSVYPWIPDPNATPTPQPTFANYPGLPSGWTVSNSGKVIPPSSATMSLQGSYISSPQALPTDSSANGPKTVTGYDDRGFTTIRTIYPEATAAPSGTGPQINNGVAIPAAPAAAAAASWRLVLSTILPWAILLLHLPGCLGL